MLELIKKLINTKLDDVVINFYISNAANAIKNYLNDHDLDVYDTYYNEVIDLACYYINKAAMSQGSVENGAIKSISSAGRSVTFTDFEELNKIGIPQTIKDRLPKPKVIVKVW